MKKLFYITLFSIALGAFFVPYTSHALTVGPAKLEYSVDPGAVIEGNMFLLNEGSETRTFYPVFQKFTELNGDKQFLNGEQTELSNWIKTVPSITLGPGEQRDIPYTITLPHDAPPGGHFAVIWWSTAAPNTSSNQPVAIVTRAGILVYLRVSGEIVETGRVETFNTSNFGRWFGGIPDTWSVVFENTGNVYLKPQGEITVKNLLGGTAAVFGVNDAGVILLPATSKGLLIRNRAEKLPFAFGIYQAAMSLSYGDQNQHFSDSFYVFIFPWKAVLIGILILLILYFGISGGIRRYNRWVIAKYAHMQSNPPNSPNQSI